MCSAVACRVSVTAAAANDPYRPADNPSKLGRSRGSIAAPRVAPYWKTMHSRRSAEPVSTTTTTQKQPTTSTVFALDFDGVVCDSVDESSLR